MTYTTTGKDVATLRAEAEQAAVKLVLEMQAEAAKLVKSRGFRLYLSELAHYAAGHTHDAPDKPEWMPDWLDDLANKLVYRAQNDGQSALYDLQLNNEDAKGDA